MSRLATLAPIDEFTSALQEVVGNDAVIRDDLAHYEVDGVLPDIAVAPANLDELRGVLAEAHAAGIAVIPTGGMQHIGAGNAPQAYDAALSLARLDRIIAHEPADMTVTVEAGARLADLQRTLGEAGQHLPLDPAGGDGATVGGVLAANAYGPLRHAHGTARDWLIGIRVVHADGSSSKSGGRVVKNVTGYDMPKLFAGSLGTLGVIAEATFKVAPLPRSNATAAIGVETARQAATIAFAANDAGLAMDAAELLSPPAAYAVLGEPRWVLLMRVAGGGAAVERSLRDLHTMSEAHAAPFAIRDGEQTWSAWRRSLAPGDLTMRVSVMPTAVAETVEVLDRRFAGAAAMMSATISAGVIRARLQASRTARAGALVAAAREVAGRHRGYVFIDAAPPSLKRQIDAFGRLRPDFAIMKRLKEQFDPQRTLSPGRFAGRL